ncbi:citryl-CoA lyase [Xanthomonas axonopodis]|uniref:citryl-CoA lyase n=1 Tax=Xanthomonas axonopodis TaxID=53413 RepID=UPI00355738A7
MIGKTTEVRSALCWNDEDRIVVRGRDLGTQLIGGMGFVEYFYFLVTGREPDGAASAVLQATLVALTEHGLVPSVQAARMTFAAAPDAMQGAVAAGILGCGSVIFGASEGAGRLLLSVEQHAAEGGSTLRDAATAVITDLRTRRHPIAGYGHPEHKRRDPRVDALFEVARRSGADMRYVDVAHTIEQVIPEILGKPLRLNASGAISAVLLGVDFPVAALKGVPMLARAAGLIAHLVEESETPIGFALAHHAVREYSYTGALSEVGASA